MDLQGAAAIVTGGASGIGAATVELLRRRGSRVASLDLVEAPAADLSFVADVADEASLVPAVAAAVEALGGLAVAVVNAGVGGGGRILDLDVAQWDRVMNVNLRGAFLTIRECARAMVAAGGGGSIVAVGSVSGFLVDRGMAHYAASKAGLAQLVRVAARELGPHGIRVNVVAPGTTETPLFAVTDGLPGYRERVAGNAALGRVGTAADVAEAVVALCDTGWVTGQVLAADGGVSLASPIDPWDSSGAR
jgi:NAD(P)-dependent dehydrogenase (short-subunit alcohol dehydrogenase family)